nr:retrovirus-related Pol polyprotein from transposon TNT 1-94 [Tanacetum cinerariifolium]
MAGDDNNDGDHPETSNTSSPEGSSSYTDEVIYFFFATQSSAPQLDYDDREKINDDDMEEMDLKWQVAMISIRIKKLYKRTRRKLQFDTKDPVGFDKTKVKCFNCHKIRHFAKDYRAKGNQDSKKRDVGYNGNKTRDNGRRPAYQDDSKALVTIDGEDIDWSGHVEDDAKNYAMMAYSFSNSGSENEVKSCSKACEESYGRLKKLYDEQRDKLGDASVEITAYTLALKRLLNTQMSANNKFGLVYGDYRYGSILSYENEVLHIVFMNKTSDLEDTPVNDRYADGIHAVPPPITGNYMPSGPDVEIDYSKFTYGLKQSSADESDSKPSEYASCESDSSVETSTSMPEPVENAPKDDPHRALKDKGIFDSGCSRNMTGNKAHLADYQELRVALFPLEHYNLFSMSQICDKKNEFLFTDTDRLVLSLDFKLPNENQKGKQHKASCKAKTDETTPILKDFIRQAKNQFNHKVKTIRSNNMTEFKNNDLIEFYGLKKIKREYSNAKTLQQNKVAKRKNRTFIEAAPTTFWAEAVNTACYVLNRVLVTKPQNKTPYELLTGKQPIISYLRPFGCHVTILNTIDQLVENQANKFEGPKEANNSVGTQANDDQGDKIEKSTDFKTCEKPVSRVEQIFLEELEKLKRQEKEDIYASLSEGIFTDSSYDDEGVVTDFKNLETTVNVSPTPTTRIHTIHPKTQILGDPMSAVQTRIKVNKNSKAHALFQIQKVWILVDLPFGKKAIGTKWVYRNKKDERGVVVRNKARLVTLGHRQEEGIDYNEVFALVARIEAIRIFLGFASYIGFIVYQIDVKSAFLQDFVYQAGKKDIMLVQVYVDDIIFGSTKKSWCDEFQELMKNMFQMISMGELTFFLGLQVKQKEDGIFISQDKYVAKILKKFDFLSVKTASTLIETQKPLVKDEEADDVDVHLYRSMIGSLMYLNAFRPDIMFAVCACSRKSTTRGSQFLGRRHISWQCKKQTIMATSTTEAEYVATAHCYGQVLWIHNQLLDYGFNFMNTKIYIDNESTICIVKNLVFHSKTKHIEIRHHFIRDAYEKKLIQVLKIHTDDNVVDLLTKAFDVCSKELASPKQRALGKDISNLLMLGRLPKTKLPTRDKGSLSVGLNTTQQMVISSPCLIHIKNWLVQKQTVSCKDFSNPFMANDLP